MPKKMTDTTTFQALEQDAYHAFIEWGLFLVLRIKQLEQHLATTQQAAPSNEQFGSDRKVTG